MGYCYNNGVKPGISMVRGCTDKYAPNYKAAATVDDGSCEKGLSKCVPEDHNDEKLTKECAPILTLNPHFCSNRDKQTCTKNDPGGSACCKLE